MAIDFNSSLIKGCRCHECGQSADLIAEVFDPCEDNKPSKVGFCFNCALLIFNEDTKHKIFEYICHDEVVDDLEEIAFENEQLDLKYGGQFEFRDHWTLDE